MSNENAIEVVAKWGGEDNGSSYAVLEYYMEKNPRQKTWRKVPGFVVAASKTEAMSQAEQIAKDLSELDIQELQPAVRKLFDSQAMVRQLSK